MAPHTDIFTDRDFNINPVILSCYLPSGIESNVKIASLQDNTYAIAYKRLILSQEPSIFAKLNMSRAASEIRDPTSTSLDHDDLEALREYAVKLVSQKKSLCPIELSDDQISFCLTHGILDYVEKAEAIIGRNFRDDCHVYTEIMKDPDIDEEWLVINVEVQGSVEEVLDMYDKATEEWVAEIPWPERDKLVLSYTIV
jgi:hypothetical protein